MYGTLPRWMDGTAFALHLHRKRTHRPTLQRRYLVVNTDTYLYALRLLGRLWVNEEAYEPRMWSWLTPSLLRMRVHPFSGQLVDGELRPVR